MCINLTIVKLFEQTIILYKANFPTMIYYSKGEHSRENFMSWIKENKKKTYYRPNNANKHAYLYL